MKSYSKTELSETVSRNLRKFPAEVLLEICNIFFHSQMRQLLRRNSYNNASCSKSNTNGKIKKWANRQHTKTAEIKWKRKAKAKAKLIRRGWHSCWDKGNCSLYSSTQTS